MELSYITPTKYIKDYQSQGSFILALSHLIDRHRENEYEKAIKETGLPIILDNGLFENHKPEGIDSLLKKANKIEATHFFSPDHLYDVEKTLKSLDHTIYVRNKNESKIKIAAVVQAKTEKEYWDLYDEYQQMPSVDLIGLSILAIPHCFDGDITSSRIEMMKKMIERGNNKKNCHLLGAGDSFKDVLFAKKNCPWVISNDSSSAFWNAIQGREINEELEVDGGKTKISVDFDYHSATLEQLGLVQKNINILKEKLCK